MKIFRTVVKAALAVWLGAVLVNTAHATPMVFDLRKPARQAEVRRYMIESPRPPYPVSARIHRRTGSGLYRIIFNKQGRVVAVTALKRTGHRDLDQAAAYGFYRWRCQPGKIDQIIVPVTFTNDFRRAREGTSEHVY